MKWEKLGNLYHPSPIHPKLLTHASNPLPVFLEGDIYRIYYSGRDSANRSSVGFVDVDIMKRKIIYIHKNPAFEFGPENSFYSHGVSIGNSYNIGRKRYILFMGWRCDPDQHWRGEIGRLQLANDFTLSLEYPFPIMPLDNTDPTSLSYPWVLENENNVYQMWYGSTLTWNAGNGEMLHVIKHAWSDDGHKWIRDAESIPFLVGTAQAFSHPSVIGNSNDGYHMWFSYRSGSGEKYRIGYAVSENGIRWELKLKEAGIEPSLSGWDSEMIEYPFVFFHKNQCFMLYNGNGYGISGFGLAVLDS